MCIMGLFLASESPRRKELLGRIIKDFTVEKAAVEELSAPLLMTPEQMVLANAALKADWVAARHPQDWVLGCDTVVVLENKVYGKPRDLAEAADFLRQFSGREHRVLTGVALRCVTRNCRSDMVEESLVGFRQLDDPVIAKYLSLVPVLDKAGAYGIQDHGDMLVESVSGELENIIGLPVNALRIRMTELGIL